MKNKALFIVFFVGLLASCKVTNLVLDGPSFLKQLYDVQKNKNGCGYYPEISYKQRQKIVEKLGFINFNSDTVYLLESFYLESGTMYSSLWTKNGKVEYKGQGEVVEEGSNFFIERLYSMIENWDINSIKNEEREHGGLMNRGDIVGSKIIIRNGKLEVACITFKEFFDLVKDRKN